MYDPDKIEMVRKDSLSETLKFLDENEQAIVFSGGTDLMVVFHDISEKQTFVTIDQHKELDGIKVNDFEIVIGATTDFGRIKRDPTICAEFPMLAEAASTVGAIAIQNRATVGGNIVNASPAADSAPSLLCYDAVLTIVSSKGERTVAYGDFHLGYKEMDLNQGELLKSITLKRGEKGACECFRKVGTRKAMAISKVSFAGRIKSNGQVRLAFGSIAATPYRARNVEEFLTGKKLDKDVVDKAVKLLRDSINPLADIRSNAVYRKRVACNLLEDFLKAQS